MRVAPERGIYWEKSLTGVLHGEQIPKHFYRASFPREKPRLLNEMTRMVSVSASDARRTDNSLEGALKADGSKSNDRTASKKVIYGGVAKTDGLISYGCCTTARCYLLPVNTLFNPSHSNC